MRTIIELFETSVKKYKNNPFLYEHMGNSYTSQTYGEIQNEVYNLACGLLATGFKKGDRAALLSEGRNYWLISELAIIYGGSINVPLSVKLDAESELLFRINHSGAKLIFTSKHQVEKIRLIKDKLSGVETIIVFDDIPLQDKEIYIGELIAKGKAYLEKNRDAFYALRDSVEHKTRR